MFRLGAVSDPILGARELRLWRCGQIVTAAGKLLAIRHRPWPSAGSVAQVWLHARLTRWNDDRCVLDYHQPLGMRGVLTVDFIRSGERTKYKTFSAAVHLLDEVARIRQCKALVANVSNANLSDRLMTRFGWERHLEHWQGRHWIKRFYNGYPPSKLGRYVVEMPVQAPIQYDAHPGTQLDVA